MPKKLKPYKLVSADTPSLLEKRVIAARKDGYIVTGGVASGTEGYTQALIPDPDAK